MGHRLIGEKELIDVIQKIEDKLNVIWLNVQGIDAELHEIGEKVDHLIGVNRPARFKINTIKKEHP